MEPSPSGQRRWLVPLAAGLCAAVVLLPQLGARSLADWDEAIYAQVAREMLERGDFLVPHYRGRPFFEKPPLYFWITIACYRVAGVSELAARLGSAFAGIGVAVVVAGLGNALGGLRVGALAPFVLLTSAGFVRSSRSGMLDVPLALATWLALVGYLRVRGGSPRGWYLVALATASGVMVKSAAGLIAPLALGVMLSFEGAWGTTLASRRARGAAALGLALLAPWPLVMLSRFGGEFLATFWHHHVVARTLEPLETHVGGADFYLRVLPSMLGAWTWLVPVALVVAVRRSLADRRVALPIFVFGATALVLVLLVRTRIAWYLLPALPALALFVASAIDEAVRSRRTTILGALVFSSLVPVTLATGATRGLAGGLLIAGLVAAARWGRRALVLGMVGALTVVCIPTLRLVHAGFRHPVAELAGAVARHDPGSPSPLVLYPGIPANLALENHEPSARFYARRPVRSASRPHELVAALAAGARHVLLAEDELKSLPADLELMVIARDRGLVAVEIRPALTRP